MPVTTKLSVKQDCLLSLDQARKAAHGVLDPKELLIKFDRLWIMLQTKREPSGSTLLLLEKEVDRYLLERSKETESKISNFVELNRKKPALLEKKISAFVAAIRKDFQKDVDGVVKKKLKKLASDDRNLREARIAVAFKATGGVLKLAGSIAALAAGCVGTLIVAAKAIKDLALEAMKALSTEQERLNKLKEKKEKLKTALESLETARAKDDGPWSKLKKAKQWLAWKKRCGEAEGARKAYRDSVTESRQKIDKMSGPMISMEKAMKSATTIKEGVKIGSQFMSLKREVRVALEGYQKKEELLEIEKSELAVLGADVDDRTWMQKLKGFKKAIESTNIDDIKKLSAGGAGSVNKIYKLAKGIMDLAANIA